MPGIRKIWDFVESKERWVIGNGSLVSFWYDRWLSQNSIMEAIEFSPIQPLEAKVDDFIIDGKWDLPTVHSLQLQSVFALVKKFTLPSISILNCGLRSRSVQVPWDNMVWSRGISPQISVFGWRLLHGRVPTDDRIMACAVPLASMCYLCNANSESMLHLFLHYSFAGMVWSEFLYVFYLKWDGFPSIQELFSWWKRKASSSSLKQIWYVSVMYVLYQIWVERNRRKYDNHCKPSSLVVKAVINDLGNFSVVAPVQIKSVRDLHLSASMRLVRSSPKQKYIKELYWGRLPVGCCKININGCSVGKPGYAGAGGIFCNHNGYPIRYLSSFEGISSNFGAEFSGFFEPINIAKVLDLTWLEVECDSKAVVWCIVQESIPWNFR
ncbi:uncharacterized protein LOC122069846 [Macadamia integrifolia]|uniref:uncharacterized protein LOC122069846 n=1 Tax=Macadamia integrifolia TaxID=60698 RepID=UPI001C4FBB42|nr:uncharacterized protein LOC122069846 [Macadamia integrifolia]